MFLQTTKKIAPYVLVFLAAFYFYYQAGSFAHRSRPGHLGPGFWPRMILALTMATCIYEILKRSFFKKNTVQDQTKPLPFAAVPDKGEMRTGILLKVFAITAAYACLLPALGSPLCTFLYFALFMIVTKYRKARVILANSLIGTLILMMIFMKAVYVSLPVGHEPFSEITFAVLRALGIG